jgi:uncharacterized protein YkwD
MRMPTRLARYGRPALLTVSVLLLALTGVYAAAWRGDDSADLTPSTDANAEWLLDVEAPPTPTPVPTAAPSPVPTPAPTQAPAPIIEPETEYVYVPAPPAPALRVSRYRADWAQSALALINQIRANSGLPAAEHDGSLQASADYYVKLHTESGDVFALNHRLDGGPGDRAWARGYCCAVGEILATAEGSPQQIVDLWMGSPSHAGVILNAAYDHVGVSCYEGRYTSETGGVIYPVICAAEFGDSNP